MKRKCLKRNIITKVAQNKTNKLTEPNVSIAFGLCSLLPCCLSLRLNIIFVFDDSNKSIAFEFCSLLPCCLSLRLDIIFIFDNSNNCQRKRKTSRNESGRQKWWSRSNRQSRLEDIPQKGQSFGVDRPIRLFSALSIQKESCTVQSIIATWLESSSTLALSR